VLASASECNPRAGQRSPNHARPPDDTPCPHDPSRHRLPAGRDRRQRPRMNRRTGPVDGSGRDQRRTEQRGTDRCRTDRRCGARGRRAGSGFPGRDRPRLLVLGAGQRLLPDRRGALPPGRPRLHRAPPPSSPRKRSDLTSAGRLSVWVVGAVQRSWWARARVAAIGVMTVGSFQSRPWRSGGQQRYPRANVRPTARRRGAAIAATTNFWALGRIVAGLVGIVFLSGLVSRELAISGATFGWRFVLLAGALAAVYALIARRSIPESPRWLAARGRLSEADGEFRRWKHLLRRVR